MLIIWLLANGSEIVRCFSGNREDFSAYTNKCWRCGLQPCNAMCSINKYTILHVDLITSEDHVKLRANTLHQATKTGGHFNIILPCDD